MRLQPTPSFVFLTLLAAALLTLPSTVSADNQSESARLVHPNPFTGETTFQLTMPKADNIRIVVFNVLGQHVRKLFDGMHDEGEDEIRWDGRDESGAPVIAGIYICVLFSDGVPVTSVKVIKRQNL